MIPVTIRPIDQWPDGWRTPRIRTPNPFQTKSYDATLGLLLGELERLDTRRAHLQLDITSADLRRDGMLRSQAKVEHPGVILTADTRAHGVLTYPCDTFARRWSSDPPDWQINLRAIALGLEALRKVERYGIAERGQQYAGFGALPPATAMSAAMTVDQAAEFIARHAWNDPGVDPQEVIDDLDAAYRAAAKELHPDAGGDPADFRRLTEARNLLEAYR